MNYEKMTKAELISKLKSLESDIKKSRCSDEVITLQGPGVKYQRIIETFKDAVIIVDVETEIILAANKHAENLLGVPVEKIVGMNRSQMYPPEDIKRYDKIFKKYAKIKGSTTTEDIFIQHKDGRKIPVEISSNIFELDGRKVLQAVIRNITGCSQAEEELNKYQILFDNVSDLAYICDTEGNILYLNMVFEKLSGYKPEEFIGKSFAPLFDKDNLKKSMDLYTRTLKGESPREEIYFKDTGILCEYRNQPLRDEKGVIVGIIGIGRDISKQKRIEKKIEKFNEYLEQCVLERTEELAKVNIEIKDNEARFRSVLSSLYESAVIIYDREGTITSLWGTPEMDKRYRMHAADVVGMSVRDFTPPEQAEKFITQIRQIIDTGRKTIYEHMITVPGGNFWHETSLSPMRDFKGKIVGVVGFIRDITERKIAESKLLKSEERFRLLAENIPEVFWITSQDFGKMIYVSPAYETIWGRSCKSLYDKPKDWFYSIHPDDREKISGAIEKHINAETSFIEEYRIVRPDKSIRWVRDRAFSIKKQSGSVDYIIGIAQDITARKETEQRLARKNSYLKLLHVTAVAANEAKNINDAFLPILEQICQYTGWEIGHAYAISDGNPDLLIPTEVWCIEEQQQFMEFCKVTKDTNFARGVGLPGRVLSSSKPHWIIDVTQDGDFHRKQSAIELNIKSGVAFPVMVESNVVAILEFFTTKSEEPDQQFMEIMAEVGTQLGRTVERKQAEKALYEASEFHNKIISELPIGISIYNQNGQCIEANSTIAKLINATREQMLAQNFKNIKSWKESGLLDAANMSIRLQKTERHEIDIVSTFGKHALFDCILAPFTAKGEQHLLLLLDDITERKKIEMTLQESEERNRSLINDVLDNSNVGVFILDKEFRVVWINESMEFYFGLNRDDIIMKAKSQLIEDKIQHIVEHGDEFKERMLRTYDDNTYVENFVCHILQNDDRQERWLEHWSQPIVSGLYAGGRIENYTDITKSKQAEKALLQSEKMKAMGIMTAGVAHEFNNILAVISSNAQLLEEINRDDKELSTSLRTICRMADDGAEIVDRMYDFTNVHKDTSSYESVDLNDLIKQVIGFTMPRWKEIAHANGITYHIVRNGAKELPSVLGNPPELREVILNIINNALDAMPGGGTITVSTRCVLSDKFGVESEKENDSKLRTQSSELKSDFIEITFADTGKGMSDEVKKMMFDPFYTTRSPQGAGLGMSISYGIMTRHGGEINVESELGKGSRICLTLPIAGKSARHVVTPIQDEKLNIGDLNILIVDDDKEMCMSLCELFTDGGQRVSSVDNGTEAIRLLKKNNYDLLICDLVMPDVTGKEVVKEMDTLNKKTKVGLITGWAYSVEDAEKDGLKVDLIIKKPFNLAILRNNINKLFNS